jgi:hypothetical protein
MQAVVPRVVLRLLFSDALERVRLQRRLVLLRIFHSFFHTLPLQQPRYVIIAVPRLGHYNVGRSYHKKQGLPFHVTKLRPIKMLRGKSNNTVGCDAMEAGTAKVRMHLQIDGRQAAAASERKSINTENLQRSHTRKGERMRPA